METRDRHQGSEGSDAPEIRTRMAGTNQHVFVWCLVAAGVIIALVIGLYLLLAA